MPARDLYHDNLKNALIKDGWTVTDDPLHLQFGKKDMYVDFGAERIIAAEKGDQKIAVEGKSFIGASEMHDLEQALGQFILYEEVMTISHPGRTLYLGIRAETMKDLFDEPLGQLLIANKRVRLVVYNEEKEVVVQWLP